MSKDLKWYQKRAKEGDLDAQFQLGSIYERGAGTAQNIPEAIQWYESAAGNGHPESAYALSKIHYYGVGVPKDTIKAQRVDMPMPSTVWPRTTSLETVFPRMWQRQYPGSKKRPSKDTHSHN